MGLRARSQGCLQHRHHALLWCLSLRWYSQLCLFSFQVLSLQKPLPMCPAFLVSWTLLISDFTSCLEAVLFPEEEAGTSWKFWLIEDESLHRIVQTHSEFNFDLIQTRQSAFSAEVTAAPNWGLLLTTATSESWGRRDRRLQNFGRSGFPTQPRSGLSTASGNSKVTSYSFLSLSNYINRPFWSEKE